ncbi:VRR-NUC domain-containing protein [Xylogone sp. PMI_703]|nr:VRR-NUC domain-containing protein [Xylogone sp. PMI_703]
MDFNRPSKRLKTRESTEGEQSPSCEISGSGSQQWSKDHWLEEIPVCDDDGADEAPGSPELPPQRPTELEAALPLINADEEAIAEYEAMPIDELDLPNELKTRMNRRKWTTGKSSIYVDAFNLALDTVLDDEGHLFDEKELEVFHQWKELNYEAQYLYVRLFLRKTSSWHRINRLTYHGDVSDISAAVKSLQEIRRLPGSSAASQSHTGEPTPPEESSFVSMFTFADSSEDKINTLDDASSLLSLEELKTFAKDAKFQGKNKAELLASFRQMSRLQLGLSWAPLKSGKIEQTSALKKSIEKDGEDRRASVMGDKYANRDEHFIRSIMASTGPCIRLTLSTLKLFERVHLVFYRSTEWTEKSLTTIILARISRRTFPEYIVSRSANIFPSRAVLLEFEAALRTQYRVDDILEFNGNPSQNGFEDVLAIFEAVYPRWKKLLKEEQRKEDQVYETGEGAYLRRFSPAWVYTRIIHKSTYVLGRLKMHEREHSVVQELLSQHLFHVVRRGAWYQRKALLEEHYMATLRPPDGVEDPEMHKKRWKKIALQTCMQGLQDNDCHVIYHYDLQKRIKKLEKSLKVVKREQHDFGHVLLRTPIEVNVAGIRVQREFPSSKRLPNNQSPERTINRSTKTIWIDEYGDGSECSVEEMCLSWYRTQGKKGYHSEGGIIRTLFAYLFYDVLFLYIPNVFQTAYQTCPLDLHTDAFFSSRTSEINHRLVEIANGEAARLVHEVDRREREKNTCIIGLDWGFALADLLEIVDCFDDAALATVCKVMAQEYRMRGGGIPDLFLWDPVKKEVMFAEVKSENDRLSDTQRMWIHVLTGAGIRVELCNAVAREVRVVPGD